jgi:hypothetical protein
MASSGTTCPCCRRAVSLTLARVLYVHMPYDRRTDVDLLARGRSCIGSGKTPEQAQQAADERTAFRAGLRLRTGGGDE